ncbi:MAG: hypothetical protein HY451_01635 [Parcubacteria group bacterium]|nr:hypothetical protein [Parcubacteria group bacterium]
MLTMGPVLKTIIYYDCLNYPLDFEEMEMFLFQDLKKDFDSFPRALNSLIEKGLIQERDGFYFLKGREELPSIRKERNEIAEKKWRKTLRAVKWLQMIPYIMLVFGSGSLALRNTDKESDLDVLIVTKHGRIWTARFLTIILLSLLGVRRTRYEKIAPDKICLNHFITDESLHIPRKSIYTAQLYARLVPVYAENKKLIDDFCEANKWIGEYVIGWPECLKTRNSKLEILNKLKTQNSKLKTFGEKILDTKLGDWVERILRKYQLRRINNFHLTHKPGGTLSAPNSHAKRGGRVKADDESLEFHPDSPELKIIEEYNKKIMEFGFKDLTERSSFAK